MYNQAVNLAIAKQLPNNIVAKYRGTALDYLQTVDLHLVQVWNKAQETPSVASNPDYVAYQRYVSQFGRGPNTAAPPSFAAWLNTKKIQPRPSAGR